MSWMGRVVHKLPYGTQRLVERYRHTALVMWSLRGVHPRRCSLCGFEGRFRAFGLPPAFDAMCGRCDSLERHRLFALIDRRHAVLEGVQSLLHFAPERILRSDFSRRFSGYVAADLFRTDVDVQCNIEDTGLPDASFDAIFASHILEHVDDRRAIPELHRLLKPGGKLIAMVPLVEAWEATYEDPRISSERDRDLHFGQRDHVRYYGRDFTARLERAAFSVRAYTASPAECVEYSLARGEQVFVATKAPS